MFDTFLNKTKTQPQRSAELSEEQAILARHKRILQAGKGYGFMEWDVVTGHAQWEGDFWVHLGYQQDDVPTITHVDNFMSYVHADDQAYFHQEMSALVREASLRTFTVRVKGKNNKFVWMEARLNSTRDDRDRVRYVSGVVCDVSDLKDTELALRVSEARHARIIQASNDGIWEWSAKEGGMPMRKSKESGRWEWGPDASSGFTFNSRCWELAGYSQDDPILEEGLMAWREMMHPDDGKRFDKMLIDHITRGTPFDIEYRVKSKQGDWRWIRGRGHMAYDVNGHPTVMSGTNMDITELKQAEERVLKAKNMAEKANQAKSEFLSSMSHELRTPLNAILGFAQLLELDTNLTSEQQDNIREIRVAGNHLLELVGDVLDLAKIEAGHMDFKMEKLMPARLIDECAKLLKNQLEKRELGFSVDYHGLQDNLISADPVRLKQVLLNLLGNAVKYNSDGGRVEVETYMSDASRLRISIKDTGKGIAPRLQADLFQPFNRLGAETSGIEGSGVGLVITKQLVERMGGRIGFVSEERIGSTFWVEFDVLTHVAGAELHHDAAKPSDGSPVSNETIPELTITQPKKILYIEDNPSNQKLMRQVIGRYPQLELTVVGLAVQGLYVARAQHPDMIILDVNLPGVSGNEMVAILKEDSLTSDLPVIALSANVMAHDIEKGLAMGFDRYLTKPLNLSELIKACNELL